MRAGSLRHAVTIERPVDTPDGQGGSTRTWTPVLDTWASLEPFGERDQQFYGQIYQRASHNVVMRHTANVSRGDRILVGDRTLDIETLQDVNERGEELRLICSERQE